MKNLDKNIMCFVKITAASAVFFTIVKLGFDKDIAEVKIQELAKELRNKGIENKNLRSR